MSVNEDPEKRPVDTLAPLDPSTDHPSRHQGNDAGSVKGDSQSDRRPSVAPSAHLPGSEKCNENDRLSESGDDSDRSSSVASSAHQHGSGKDLEAGRASEARTEVTAGPSGEPSDDSQHEETLADSGEVDLKNLPPPVFKDRKDRQGILARLCLFNEAEEPKHYSRRTKWFITAIVAFAAIAAPIGSNILLPSLADINQDLHSQQNVTNLSISLYVAALGIFPVFWSSFSEVLGRRTVMVVSFGIATVFNVLSAVSVNVGMFLTMRILAGGASASVQAVGGGVIADIWHVQERGNAMASYYMGPLMGPLIGPIIGGGLQLRFGWRSTMWFNTIYSVITFALLLLCLPETIKKLKRFGEKEAPVPVPVATNLRPTLSRVSSRQSLKDNSKLVMRIFSGIFIQPFTIFRYLQFPAVIITIYYASITFGSLYMLQISIENTFSHSPYNFSTLEVGLTYVSSSLGYACSSILAGKWTDRIMAREARKAGRTDRNGKLIYRPEDRMKENLWTAAILYPSALLWWGWTAQKGVFWLVPLIANFFFGVGSMIVFATVTTMLTEFMPTKAASAIALNNLLRMITAAIGIAITQPLLDAIGSGWTFTAVFIIAVCSSSIIWIMKHFGPRWRKTMDERMKEKGL